MPSIVGGIFIVARETLRLREIAGRSCTVNSGVGCVDVVGIKMRAVSTNKGSTTTKHLGTI